MQLDRASAGSAPVATSIYSQTRNRGYTLIPSNEKDDDGGDKDSPNRIMHFKRHDQSPSRFRAVTSVIIAGLKPENCVSCHCAGKCALLRCVYGLAHADPSARVAA